MANANSPPPNLAAVTTRIIELVLSLKPEERFEVLEWLEQRVAERQRREHPRSGAYITVDLTSVNATFRGLIRNVSAAGVFVLTEEPLALGEAVSLAFPVPDSREMIRVSGVVTRLTEEGAGIRFESQLDALIRHRGVKVVEH